MNGAEWLACADPVRLLMYLKRNKTHKASARKLRLFVVASCRRVWDLLTDIRSRTAVEVIEKCADGLVSMEELRAACKAAYEVFTRSDAAADWAASAVAYGAVAEPDLAALGATRCAFARHRTGIGVERAAQTRLLRELLGNPFRPVGFDPTWRTPPAVAIARTAYEERRFEALPILADALEEAGCRNAAILEHCRSEGEHVRGCWVVDQVLEKE
jgi:hypothetical protein